MKIDWKQEINNQYKVNGGFTPMPLSINPYDSSSKILRAVQASNIDIAFTKLAELWYYSRKSYRKRDNRDVTETWDNSSYKKRRW